MSLIDTIINNQMNNIIKRSIKRSKRFATGKNICSAELSKNKIEYSFVTKDIVGFFQKDFMFVHESYKIHFKNIFKRFKYKVSWPCNIANVLEDIKSFVNEHNIEDYYIDYNDIKLFIDTANINKAQYNATVFYNLYCSDVNSVVKLKLLGYDVMPINKSKWTLLINALFVFI